MEKKLSAKKKIAAAVAAVAAVCVVGFAGYTYAVAYAGDTVHEGVTFMGESLAGKTYDEALKQIESKVESLGIKESVKVKIGFDEFTFDTGLSEDGIDCENLAQKAFDTGRTGNFIDRLSDINSVKKNGLDINLTFEADEEKIDKGIEEIKSTLISDPAELFEIDGDKIKLNLSYGLAFDGERLKTQLSENIKNGDFSDIDYEMTEEDMDKIDVSAIKQAIDREMKEPTVDVNDRSGQTVIGGQVGIEVDEQAIKDAIKNSAEDVIEIPVTVTEPTYTDEEYKSMLFRDVLSSQTTTFNGNLTGRTGNIKIAAEDCERVLMPGETFSYTEQVGRITRDKGYKDALVFSQGEVVDGLGGGVCQVSSTIYMAAMYADMEIGIRRNHSFVVSYTPVGQDATFVYGGQDFTFKNNTAFPVRIDTVVGKNSLTVKIIGTQTTPGKEIKVVTEILSKDPYEVKEVYDPSLQPGERKVKNEGYTGYKANTYRVTYINGKEVSRVFEASSSYKRLDKVILVGTDPNAPVVNPEPPTEVPTENPSTSESTSAPTESTSQSESASQSESTTAAE